MPDLDLRSLEIFRAVATEGSVSKAALKLNRVQSNVSTRVKQLEQRVAKNLFRRGNRGLTLTPDGELLLSFAERLLHLSREAEEALNEGRPHGTFKIGAMESTAAARLPAILSGFHQSHPQVKIELLTDTAGGLLRRLNDHDIDIAFAAEPIAFENFSTQTVFQEQLVLITPQSFPPLENTRRISGRTVVAFEVGCAYRRYLEEWLLEAGIVPGGFLSMGSYLAILACVSAGTGFAVVPQCILDTVASVGQFQRYPLPGKLSRIRTMAAWRSDYRSATLDALREVLPSL